MNAFGARDLSAGATAIGIEFRRRRTISDAKYCASLSFSPSPNINKKSLPIFPYVNIYFSRRRISRLLRKTSPPKRGRNSEWALLVGINGLLGAIAWCCRSVCRIDAVGPRALLAELPNSPTSFSRLEHCQRMPVGHFHIAAFTCRMNRFTPASSPFSLKPLRSSSCS